MNEKELIQKAMAVGSSAGQIALAEYIIKTYAELLPVHLQVFLQKVCDEGYRESAKVLDMPSEDLALIVGKLLEDKA